MYLHIVDVYWFKHMEAERSQLLRLYGDSRKASNSSVSKATFTPTTLLLYFVILLRLVFMGGVVVLVFTYDHRQTPA